LPPDRALQLRASTKGRAAGAGAPRRRVPSASQLELEVVPMPSVATRVRPAPPPFFWSRVAQHLARAAARIPLRDVEAAVAGAGAVALWALALSLLVA
jgi:hypothetical protein